MRICACGQFAALFKSVRIEGWNRWFQSMAFLRSASTEAM